MIRRRQTSSAREAPGEAYGSPVTSGPLGAKKARQDSCCTTAFLNAHHSTPQGPSKGMVSLLCSTQCSSSQQLYSAIAAGARAFCAAGAAGAEAGARDVLDRLQEMHSCIVALDDKLDDCVSKPEESTVDLLECRQWLKHTQGYLLHLQKQVMGFCGDGHSTTSSMDDAASSSSNSTTAGTGDCFEWRVLCQEAADCLASVAQHMEPACSSDGGSSWVQLQQQASRSAVSAQHSSRLVAGRSCLSYSQFWSKKIAL